VLAGTPIGDARDASPHLAEVLSEAHVIAAEDTRRLRRLCERLGVEPSAKVVSYFDGNEVERTPMLAQALADGETVVVVTDAGMPSVSDPGFRLVRAALDLGVAIDVVPGPSAVLAALAVSGLPVARFCFEGFVPRKAGERANHLAGLAREPRTMVFFEAPHRLAEFLDAALAAFGASRPAAVCRELTKPHQEVVRGPLSQLAEWAQGPVLGEVTVVVGGWTGLAGGEADDALAAGVAAVRAAVASGATTRAAVDDVAAAQGLRRKTLYDAVLKAAVLPRSGSRGVHPTVILPQAGSRGVPPAVILPQAGSRELTGDLGGVAAEPTGSCLRQDDGVSSGTDPIRPTDIAQTLADLGFADMPPQLPRPLIDSHTHLDAVFEKTGLRPVDNLTAAAATGVDRVVQIGCDVESSRWAVDFAASHPSVAAAVAIHPNDAARMTDRELESAVAEIDALAGAGRHVRAVGETGLDYYRTRDDAGRARQRASFTHHIAIAAARGLTLAIHDRDAHADILRVLDEAPVRPERVIMHCFSAGPQHARECGARGYWLSFPGTVTFKDADDLRDALAVTPLDRLLVETDAPYLTPVPARGRPNASYLVAHTAAFVAEHLGLGLAEACDVLTANAEAAYGGAWGRR